MGKEGRGNNQELSEGTLCRTSASSSQSQMNELKSRLKDCEALLATRDREIATLHELLAARADDRFREVGRVTCAQCIELSQTNASLHAEHRELQLAYKTVLAQLQDLKDRCTFGGSPRSPGKEMQKEMKKTLAGVYKEIVSLSKAISGLLKGDEPNMQALLGSHTRESKEQMEFAFQRSARRGSPEEQEELTLQDLEVLKEATATIRTTLCDYYAEKYSNECNVQ